MTFVARGSGEWAPLGERVKECTSPESVYKLHILGPDPCRALMSLPHGRNGTIEPLLLL